MQERLLCPHCNTEIKKDIHDRRIVVLTRQDVANLYHNLKNLWIDREYNFHETNAIVKWMGHIVMEAKEEEKK